MEKEKNLGIGKLTLFAISTTLASGVFSLSGDFAAGGAHTLAVLIGWAICGIGMAGLAVSFYRLSVVKPELSSGIFNYAKTGFGDYIGFINGWGYWISAILAPVSYVALLFATLGNFFDAFGDGNNLLSVVVGSLYVWFLILLVYRGVNSAVGINAVVVIAKLVPIIFTVFAIILMGAFKPSIFMENFAGAADSPSLLTQVKGTVTTTVWTFIGIEGAVVLSARAKNTKIAGKATINSFLALLILYVLISVLSMGVMPQEELAKLSNPPMAGVMAYVVGPWGATLVNCAVILSVAGAMLSYVILCTDSAYQPAVNGLFPKFLSKLNRYDAPTWSVLGTGIVLQFFIIMIYVAASSYQKLYAVSTSTIMFPYFFSALYYLKLCIQGHGCDNDAGGKAGAWLAAVVGTVYGLWLLYATGWQYILITTLCYAPGTILYYWSKKERNEKVFPKTSDLAAFIVVMVLFVISIVLLANGTIKPF